MKKLNNYTLSDLETELIIRFGENWMTAEIEPEDYPFGKYAELNLKCFEWSIRSSNDRVVIWNENGKIYDNGIWAARNLKELPEQYVMWGGLSLQKYTGHYKNYPDNVIISGKELNEVFLGYQFITKKQYEKLTNKTKIGDVGVFWDDGGGKFISVLTYKDYPNEPYRYSSINGGVWEKFEPITDPSDLEVIKKYLDYEKR